MQNLKQNLADILLCLVIVYFYVDYSAVNKIKFENEQTIVRASFKQIEDGINIESRHQDKEIKTLDEKINELNKQQLFLQQRVDALVKINQESKRCTSTH